MKKNTLKIFSLILMVSVILLAFSGCAKKVDAGSYSGELSILGQSLKVIYTFQGNKVEAQTKVTFLGQVNTETASGTYEIIENADGTMEIRFEFDAETDHFENKTLTFEQGEDYIELGGVKYTKAE